MSNSSKFVSEIANKGSNVFRQTFKHSTKDVTNYFPGHMAKGESASWLVSEMAEHRVQMIRAMYDSRKNGHDSRTELVVFGAYIVLSILLYSAWIEYHCRLATES